VAPTEDASLSRMTLVTRGNDEVIEQITKQLNKLVDVVKLIDLADAPHIERELMLVKIKTSHDTREEVKRMVDIFRGKIIDVTPASYVVEMTGQSSKLDAFVHGFEEGSIIEVVRSGPTGISRGEKGLHL
ncbi:MAG: hypothetical protein RL563_246, partial [Pseudomonadota bacterium]